jgi:hypothetical protein
MSDYTPTDELIRNGYLYVDREPGEDPSVVEGRKAEYDRWITQHDAEVRKAALNAAADAVPPSTPPLGGELAISEPVRMRFQEWLRAQAGGAA